MDRAHCRGAQAGYRLCCRGFRIRRFSSRIDELWIAFHLDQDGFDRAVIEETVRLRTLVNEYFRGHVSRKEAVAELLKFEHEPWYENGYLYPSHELPVDIRQSKSHYEMD